MTTNQRMFRKIVIEYRIGDIQWLRNASCQADKAGPLVGWVLTGMETVGGFLYGFNKSYETFKKFARNKMTNTFSCFDDSDLKAFYEQTRCGIVHQGMVKEGWVIALLKFDDSRPAFFRCEKFNYIDVLRLTDEFIRTVQSIDVAEVKYPFRRSKVHSNFGKLQKFSLTSADYECIGRSGPYISTPSTSAR